MTSPSTQEDLSRNELINGNIDLISSIMSLMESLEGSTQKKILENLVSEILKMPEIANFIREDQTPEEEVAIDGEMTGGDFGGPDIDIDTSGEGGTSDMSDAFSGGGSEGSSDSGEFTADEYSSFEDEL